MNPAEIANGRASIWKEDNAVKAGGFNGSERHEQVRASDLHLSGFIGQRVLQRTV